MTGAHRTDARSSPLPMRSPSSPKNCVPKARVHVQAKTICRLRDGEQTADADTNAWFGKLPPEKQSEVVKYAALHIAKNSKLFELTEHGGNYQEYLKLSFCYRPQRGAGGGGHFCRSCLDSKGSGLRGEAAELLQEM